MCLKGAYLGRVDTRARQIRADYDYVETSDGVDRAATAGGHQRVLHTYDEGHEEITSPTRRFETIRKAMERAVNENEFEPERGDRVEVRVDARSKETRRGRVW